MSVPERRFNEAEVAAILERAMTRDEPGRQVGPGGEGLTLAQIQEIGREIGLAPAAIAESAWSLEAMGREATRRFIGLPLGVERVVPLPRRLSDEEWERVVVSLREVFDARGVVRQEGSLRQWRNGNLQALLEPTEHGQRIRLRTVKGNALGYMTMGALFFGAGATGIVATVMGGAADPGAMTTLAIVAAAGAGVLTTTAARLFPWARRRREQMTEVASRVAALDRLGAPDASSIAAGPPLAR